jgi:hypothetical protein
MATTPIYGFVTPDLANTADGPAAMAALALRVEREMSTLRASQEFSQEPLTPYNANTNGNVLHTVTVATGVIGWITIDANVLLNVVGGTPVDSNGVYSSSMSGWVKLLVDNVQVRQYRFHSVWGTRTMLVPICAAVTRTAAQTSTQVKVTMDIDSGSTPVNYVNSHVYVVQYGAPATG